MDHRAHRPLDSAEVTDAVLANAPVLGAGDHRLGTILHIVHGAASTGIVVSIAGASGENQRQVVISLTDLDLMRDETGTVHALTSLSREEFDALPSYSG